MSGTINIAENDTAQVVVNRAIRRLYKENTVKLYCKEDYRRVFDIMHSITCKIRRNDADVVWKVVKYRNAQDVTVSEFTGYFNRNGRINSNPFEVE